MRREVACSLSLRMTDLGAPRFRRTILARLIQSLHARQLLPPRFKVTVRPGRGSEVVSSAQLADLAAQWPEPVHVKLRATGDDDSGTVLCDGARIDLNLYHTAPTIEREADTLLARLFDALGAAAAMADDLRFERYCCVSVRNLGYPRPRPLQVPLVVTPEALVDLIDRRTTFPPEERTALETIRSAALPEGATRHEHGPVTLINWAADCTFADVDRLRQRLAARDRWLMRVGASTIHPDWNAQGDARHGFIGGEPHPALTLFTPALGLGYKAIHSGQPPAEIEATLQSAARWIAEKRVDERTEVSNVIIIADSRDAALALKPRLDAAGVRSVVYPADDGSFWDPFPMGEWIAAEPR